MAVVLQYNFYLTFAGDKAVAGKCQTDKIPEHAQSGHLFQFFGDLVIDRW